MQPFVQVFRDVLTAVSIRADHSHVQIETGFEQTSRTHPSKMAKYPTWPAISKPVRVALVCFSSSEDEGIASPSAGASTEPSVRVAPVDALAAFPESKPSPPPQSTPWRLKLNLNSFGSS